MSNPVSGHVLDSQVLIITARVGGGLDAIEEMDKELTKVIEDFDRAVNIEALRLTKESGKCSLNLAIVHSQPFI